MARWPHPGYLFLASRGRPCRRSGGSSRPRGRPRASFPPPRRRPPACCRALARLVPAGGVLPPALSAPRVASLRRISCGRGRRATFPAPRGLRRRLPAAARCRRSLGGASSAVARAPPRSGARAGRGPRAAAARWRAARTRGARARQRHPAARLDADHADLDQARRSAHRGGLRTRQDLDRLQLHLGRRANPGLRVLTSLRPRQSVAIPGPTALRLLSLRSNGGLRRRRHP